MPLKHLSELQVFHDLAGNSLSQDTALLILYNRGEMSIYELTKIISQELRPMDYKNVYVIYSALYQKGYVESRLVPGNAKQIHTKRLIKLTALGRKHIETILFEFMEAE